MTAITDTTRSEPLSRPQGWRIMKVVRLQFVNRWTFVWTPLIVFGAAWSITMAMLTIIDRAAGDDGPATVTGGTQAPLWYLFAVGLQSMTLTFPFSQALSLTRKEFFTGTVLSAVFSTGGLAVLFVLLGWLEEATNGYGINAYFGYLSWVWAAGPLAAWLTYFTLGMFFYVVGFWVGTIFKRFGSVILTVCGIGVAIVLLGIVALITFTESWSDVARLVMDLKAVGLTVVGLVLTALLSVGAYLTLRTMPA
jgi:hypothetical protein